jgi:AraC-like DNA-binding protein
MVHSHTDPFAELPVFSHVSEAICNSNHVHAEHSHPVFEVCYVLAGKAVRMVDGTSVVIGPGDFYLIRPGEVHSATTDRVDPYHYFAIGFAPEQLLSRVTLGDAAAKPFSGARQHEGDLDLAVAEASAVEYELRVLEQRVVHGGQGAEHIYRRILRELDRLDDCDALQRSLALVMVQTLMIELLVFVTRCSIAQQEHTPISSLRLREPVRTDFQDLLSWLETRIVTPPTLGEMAARVHLSPAHFTVAFKREVGQTPLEFITGLRIDEAARRLANEVDSSITDIALDLGFSTSQYFSLVFRKTRGCTPSEWRAKKAKMP